MEDIYELTLEEDDDTPVNVDCLTLDNWVLFEPVRKEPITVHACQMPFSQGFVVTTLEGVMSGKQGDYLMVGVNGEKYPCRKDIFEKTYKKVVELCTK